MYENIARHRIQRVSEAAIMDQAYHYGQQKVALIEKGGMDKIKQDTLVYIFDVEALWLSKSNPMMRPVEARLLDVYLYDSNRSLTHHIQPLGKDTLLFIQPYSDAPHDQVRVLGIRLTRKQVILSMSEPQEKK